MVEYRALKYPGEYWFPKSYKKSPLLFFAHDYLNNLVVYLVILCQDRTHVIWQLTNHDSSNQNPSKDHQYFLPKNHNFHNLGYWDSLQHLWRSYSVLLQLLRNLLIKSCFLFWWDLFFQEDDFFRPEWFDSYPEMFVSCNVFLV